VGVRIARGEAITTVIMVAELVSKTEVSNLFMYCL
jgi:hypothetical protein